MHNETRNHTAIVNDWIAWKDEGIGTMRWSPAYRTIQVSYLRKFLAEYKMVSAANLEACLRAVPFRSHSKRQHIQSAVSSFAEFLTLKGVLNIEERERIRKLYPKRDRYNKPVQKIINEQEFNTLIETAKRNTHRYQSQLNTALIRLLALTGLRVSEICNLKLSDIVLSPPERAHLRVLLGKGGKDRIVPLTQEMLDIIYDYLKYRPQVTLQQLFVGFNPQHGYTALNRHCVARRFQRISIAAGIPFTAHSLRHLFITTLAKDPRFTLPLIQKIVGHSSVTVTEGYIHLDENALFHAFRLA